MAIPSQDALTLWQTPRLRVASLCGMSVALAASSLDSSHLIGNDALIKVSRVVSKDEGSPKLLEAVSAPLLQPPFLDEGSTEALPSPSNTNAAPKPGATDAPKNQQQN